MLGSSRRMAVMSRAIIDVNSIVSGRTFVSLDYRSVADVTVVRRPVECNTLLTERSLGQQEARIT